MDFIDLKKQYQIIKPSVQKRLNAILDRSGYIMGPEVPELESTLAQFVGVPYCVTCSSGTDALLLALMAHGIGPGDAVFTTPFTFFATAEVIALVGATPVFVDVDAATFNMDAVKLHNAIASFKNGTPITNKFPQGLTPKAIIGVDIFGLCSDYDAIEAIARDNNLVLIEDAAQSFGATYMGRRSCSFGSIGCTSFFPAKPLGCYGDGGALFLHDKERDDLVRSLRVHGQGVDKYENVRIGINGRLDTMQAAVLLAKMELFETELAARQRVALRYSDGLRSICTVPHIPEGYTSAWAQYSVLSPNRDRIIAALGKQHIPTAIYYTKPLHLQTAFAHLGYEAGSLPVAEALSKEIFSLPMHPYLGEQDQDTIINVIKASA
jgi:UDP-2-acetamido-2-deoxy-ribo-hexuluronate aminotransferase